MIHSAHLIAVGDEVLWGETINSNAAWMAQFLMRFGVRPTYQCVVADDLAAIADAVLQSLSAAELVVVMGGLGPTPDDRTVQAVAHALGRRVTIDEPLRSRIAAHHGHARGWHASVEKQAGVIQGAQLWMNPRGQAPGQCLQGPEGVVVLLPGPPRELQGIVESHMAEWLQQRTEGRIHRDTYSIFDLGESTVASYIRRLLDGEHPKVGIYASPGRVDVRVETEDSPHGAVLRARSRALILSQIPVAVFELEGSSREAFLIRWLAQRGQTLAAMESLTGGLVLSSLIAVPGASMAILGGIVAYTDAVKAQAGVPEEILLTHGAVSEPCAEAMAKAARSYFQADWAIATTGFAGPQGGSPQDPVGTFYVAAAGPQKVIVRRRYAPLEREAVRQIAHHTAISAVWELLKLPTLLTDKS